jgi:hypothetical protein
MDGIIPNNNPYVEERMQTNYKSISNNPNCTEPTNNPNCTEPTNNTNCTEPTNNPNCTEPTNNNPFMNFLTSDYADDPTRTPACKNNKIINADIDKKFNNNYNNYYYDNNDVFLNGENQLPFYTMPVTKNPNDQTKLAEWLYYVPDTCKTNQLYCAEYEDLRFKR